jgi:hypothetical protein
MKIRQAIDAGDTPLLRMAKNYRSTVRTAQVRSTVQESVDSTIDAIKGGIAAPTTEAQNAAKSSEVDKVLITNPADVVESKDSFMYGDIEVSFKVIVEPGDNKLFQLIREDDSWVVSVNRAHPFINSFANLPGADINPVLRLAVALGIAEINARNSDVDHPAFIRHTINEILTGPLGRKREI